MAAALAIAGSTSMADRADAATVVVDSLGDASTNDGDCTLREAIVTTNDNAQVAGAIAGDCAAGEAGPAVRDTIVFSVGVGVKTISPASVLPMIEDPVEIDGQNGAEDAIRIEIDGSAVVGTAFPEHGLFVTTGSAGSYLHHLAVFGFPDDGFHLFSDEITVDRVISGMDQEGTTASGNGRHGVTIRGDSTTIERSVVAGNAVHGINIEPSTVSTGTGTTIRGNRIGTTKTGSAAVPNGQDGINVSLSTVALGGGPADGITIGGTTDPTPGGACDGDCNLVSGNTESGIEFKVAGPEPECADGLLIEGNYVGADLAGTAAIPNSPTGNQGAVKLVGATKAAAMAGGRRTIE